MRSTTVVLVFALSLLFGSCYSKSNRIEDGQAVNGAFSSEEIKNGVDKPVIEPHLFRTASVRRDTRSAENLAQDYHGRDDAVKKISRISVKNLEFFEVEGEDSDEMIEESQNILHHSNHQSEKVNQHVDGRWGTWSDWSPCPDADPNTQQVRTRFRNVNEHERMTWKQTLPCRGTRHDTPDERKAKEEFSTVGESKAAGANNNTAAIIGFLVVGLGFIIALVILICIKPCKDRAKTSKDGGAKNHEARDKASLNRVNNLIQRLKGYAKIPQSDPKSDEESESPLDIVIVGEMKKNVY